MAFGIGYGAYLAAAAVIGAGAATYSAVDSHNQANAAREQQDKLNEEAKARQATLLATQKKRSEDEKAQALLDETQSQQSALKRASEAKAGRQGTILTSPLGVTGTPASGGKTLLGS